MSKGFVYITGCDTGFGRLSVDLFLKEDISVFAGVFNPASVQLLQNECGPNVYPIQLNVTSEESVKQAASLIKITLQHKNAKLLAVVNNAGILVQPCPTEWQRMKDFRDMFEVNVIGMATVTQSVLPLLRASQGRVVLCSSLLGRLAAGTEAAYCASKFAVQGYADALRKDMLPWGVSVHVVEPGVFPNTGLYAKFETGLDQVWQELDEDIKADYGEAHYRYCRKLIIQARHNFGTADSSLVGKAYVHAATSPQAMYRYRIGVDSKYFAAVLANCHEYTQDMVLTMETPGLRYIKPNKAPVNGKQIATARMDKGWNKFLLLSALSLFAGIKLHQASL